MVTFFMLLYAVGIACFILFILEGLQGRMTMKTRWSDVTVDQWVLAIGSLCVPIGFIGMLFAR